MEQIFKIKLKYTPPIGGVHTVSVAGSFNKWEPQEMVSESGNYVLTLHLIPGRYTYKFIVDGQWLADETADCFQNDNQGGRNSVLIVQNPSSQLYLVPFEYDPGSSSPTSVAIAGSFNNWQIDHHFMKKNQSGKYDAIILLPEDIYQYKFILNGNDWIEDYKNPKRSKDNLQGFNSLIHVDSRLPLYGDKCKDIFTYNLFNKHYPRCEKIGNNLLRLACRTYLKNVDSVSVQINDANFEMHNFFHDNWFDYYSVTIPLPDTELKSYEVHLYKNGLMKSLHVKETQKSITDPVPLAWLQKSVIYQIFTDRFCNGDSALNPDFSEDYYDSALNPLSAEVRDNLYRLEENWDNYELLKDHPQRNYTFYGGDLKGVIEKIPYLKNLGISSIYFNPLVLAASNHKYDTFDYLKVDPHFGGEKLFRELVKLCHKEGISLILDFAFNHVGTWFFAFQDCLKKREASPYFNWFDWYKLPLPDKITDDFQAEDYYQCWWGHASLPDLNFDLKRFHPEENPIHNQEDAEVNQPLVDYLLKVAEYWLCDLDIDGFRLDVPNEVPFWFWKLFKNSVKALKPEAYLVGEIWHNAEDWVENYFDAVMNYTYFREPMLQFFALQNWSLAEFLEEMMTGLHRYGFYKLSLMMNLMDSHDTHRFLQACDGEIERYKLAIFFQMSWIGVPHIFYGDEVGLTGGNDPDNRRPMNWNYSQNSELQELHDFIKQLILIRSENDILIYGDLIVHDEFEGVIFFERRLCTEMILIILNPLSQIKKITLPADYTLKVQLGKVETNNSHNIYEIKLPPFTGIMLKSIDSK